MGQEACFGLYKSSEILLVLATDFGVSHRLFKPASSYCFDCFLRSFFIPLSLDPALFLPASFHLVPLFLIIPINPAQQLVNLLFAELGMDGGRGAQPFSLPAFSASEPGGAWALLLSTRVELLGGRSGRTGAGVQAPRSLGMGRA